MTLNSDGDTDSDYEVTIAKFSKSVSESELELIEKNFSEFKPESTPPRNPSIFSILLPGSFYFLHVWVQKKNNIKIKRTSVVSVSHSRVSKNMS